MNDHKQIPVRGWYLENRNGNHFKFYTALVTDTGVVVYHWGRIGTSGQATIDQLTPSQAKTAAIKKVHSKIAGGYEFETEDLAFMLDERDINRACERPDPKSLTLLFDRAKRDPKFTGEKDTVVAAYDTFLGNAQRLMDAASNPLTHFDTVVNDFEELKAAWTEIEDKHSLAATTLSMTSKMLTQSLISGKLS